MISSICERKCETCILRPRCGGCSMCEASICIRQCSQCSALCFRRAPSYAYLSKALGGPYFSLKSNVQWDVPYHIPVIPDRLPPNTMKLDYIGIHGQHAFARNGSKVNKSYLENGYAAAINVNSDAKGI